MDGLNPFGIVEIVYSVGLGCNFTPKSSGIFKVFRSVCRIWRDVGGYMIHNPAIELGNKANVLWNEYKSRFIKVHSDIMWHICEQGLATDDVLFEIVKSNPAYSFACLQSRKIECKKLLHLCLQYDPEHSITYNMPRNIKGITPKFIIKHTHKPKILSLLENDDFCSRYPRPSLWPTQIKGDLSKFSYASAVYWRISKNLKDNDIIWIFNNLTEKADLCYYIDNKTDEELDLFVERCVGNDFVIISASGSPRFRQYFDYTTDGTNLCVVLKKSGKTVINHTLYLGQYIYTNEYADLIQYIPINSNFLKMFDRGFHSSFYLTYEQINYVYSNHEWALRVTPNDFTRKLNKYSDYLQLLPVLQGGDGCWKAYDPTVPLNLIRSQFGLWSVARINQNITLQFLLDEGVEKLQIIKIMLSNPKFTAVDVIDYAFEK